MPDEHRRDEFDLPPYHVLRETCPVLKFFTLIGRNWVYPVLIRMAENQSYTFPQLLKLTSKRMPKSSLSKALNEMEDLSIIEQHDGTYRLTAEGASIQRELAGIQQIIALRHQDRLRACRELCGDLGFFNNEACDDEEVTGSELSEQESQS